MKGEMLNTFTRIVGRSSLFWAQSEIIAEIG